LCRRVEYSVVSPSFVVGRVKLCGFEKVAVRPIQAGWVPLLGNVSTYIQYSLV
jgi:hypothetical protein